MTETQDHPIKASDPQATGTDQAKAEQAKVQGEEARALQSRLDSLNHAGGDAKDDTRPAEEKPNPEKAGEVEEKTRKRDEARLAAAKHLGYEEDDLEGFTDKDWRRLMRESRSRSQLESLVGTLKQKVLDLTKAAQTRTDEQPEKKGTKDSAKDTAAELDWDVDNLTVNDDFDKYVESHNRMATRGKTLVAELKAIREELASLREAPAQRQDEQDTVETEKFIADLPKSIYEEFGDGPAVDLPDDAPELQMRIDLADEADRAIERAKRRGKTLSRKDALDQALRVVAPESWERHQEKLAKDRARARDSRAAGFDGPGARASDDGLTQTEKDARKLQARLRAMQSA